MISRRRRAFTITEIVIVIAAIGILAAVLIPTFSTVIAKANDKSAISDAKNSLTAYLVKRMEDTNLPGNVVVFVYKASAYYVFGYSTDMMGEGSGQLLQSTGNGTDDFKGWRKDQLSAFIATWNEPIYAIGDEYEGDKYFHLTPNSGESAYSDGNVTIMRSVSVEISNAYNYIDDRVQNVDGTNDIAESSDSFEGYLLPGKYMLATGELIIPEKTYEITVNPGIVGGLADVPDGIIEVGEDFALADFATTYPSTCDGYYFRGYSIDDDNQNNQTHIIVDDMTLYACWDEIPPTMHTISLNVAGGAFPSELSADGWTIEDDIAEKAFVENTSVAVILSGIVPAKENNDFEGWGIDLSHTILLRDNASYTASWSLTTYAVIIEGGAPAGAAVSNLPSINPEYSYGATVNLSEFAPACSGGYELSGWSYNGTAYDTDGTISMPSHAILLVAQWSMPTFTIEYYDGLTLLFSDSIDKTGDNGSATRLRGALSKTGYTFNGWSIDSSRYAAEQLFSYAGVTAGSVVKANAIFSANRYTVTFNKGYGTPEDAVISTQSVLHGADATPPVDPTRSEYTFTGWDRALTNITSDTTITATWIEAVVMTPVTVTFYDVWNQEAFGTTITVELPSTKTTFCWNDIPASTEIPGYFQPYDINLNDISATTFAISGGAVTLNYLRMTDIGGSSHICITNITGLLKIRNQLLMDYILLNNITLASDCNYSPIGFDANGSDAFNGTFNGNGKTITNWRSITSSDYTHFGLFAGLGSTGVVKHLNMDAAYISNAAMSGVICGENMGGDIINCHVTNSTVQIIKDSYGNGYSFGYSSQYGTYAGGICGANASGSTISYCTVNNTYIGRRSTDSSMVNNSYGINGGIVGLNAGTINNCLANAAIVGTWGYGSTPTTYARVGGIAGQNSAGASITHCYNYNCGVGAYAFLGGVIGWNGGTVQYVLFANYSKGVYNGSTNYVARWIGYNGGTVRNLLYESSSNTTINSSSAIYGRTAANLKGTNITYMTSAFGTTNWTYASGAYPTLKTWTQRNGSDYWNN